MYCDECLLFGSTMSIDIKYVGMIYNRFGGIACCFIILFSHRCPWIVY